MRNGRHVETAKLLGKLVCVIALAGPDREPPPGMFLLQGLEHRMSGLPLGSAGRLAVLDGHDQTVAIIHGNVAHEGKLRFFTRAYPEQECFRIGCGLMGIITAFLAVEVDGGIAKVLGVRARGLRLLLKALLAGPRLDERAIDREVVITHQVFLFGQGDNPCQKALGEVPVEQAVSVFAEDGVIPERASIDRPWNHRNRGLYRAAP